MLLLCVGGAGVMHGGGSNSRLSAKQEACGLGAMGDPTHKCATPLPPPPPALLIPALYFFLLALSTLSDLLQVDLFIMFIGYLPL